MGADQSHDWNATIASAIDWWRDAGVDVELSDAPRDWLNAAPAAAAVGETAIAPVAAPPSLPATLEAFATWRTGPDALETGWGAKLIPADGPANAELMVLIEMPEREDAVEGRLLGGASGRLFDRMLAAIGLGRDSIHLASVACARPTTGRIPREAVDPLGALARHYVGLVAPKRLLLLGNCASRTFFDADVAQTRGLLRPLNHDGATMALTSFHPQLLLERPALKAEAWKDLQMLMRPVAS
ncbi:MAG: uracil-DNA glycosylase [Pseudomonadota bacterium]